MTERFEIVKTFIIEKYLKDEVKMIFILKKKTTTNKQMIKQTKNSNLNYHIYY